MQGSYQIADLEVTIDGSMKELAKAQNVEREFRRACRRLRTQSGADEAFFRVDTELEGENGTFHKFRLRAYAPNAPEVYTIDCGITDENPLGVYVGWNAPIEIYNRETQQVRTIDPKTGEVTEGRDGQQQESTSAANPSGTPEASASQQRNTQQRTRHESEEMYDANAGSTAGTNGKPSPEQAARQLAETVRQQYEPSVLAGEAQLASGDLLSQKLRGLVEYAGRDHGYQARVLDALGVGGFDEVAVGQLGDVTQMIVDEDTLRENESFEPQDDLPF